MPKRRVLGTVGLIINIGLSINGYWHTENKFDERNQDWLVQKLATSKSWRDSGRASQLRIQTFK